MGEDLVEEPVAPAVEVIPGEDVVAGGEEAAYYRRGRRGEAGGEGEAVAGAFEGSYALLQGGSGRVAAPAVLVALFCPGASCV